MEVVDGLDRRACRRRPDRPPARRPPQRGRPGRRTHEQPGALGEPHRGPQLRGHLGRGQPDAEGSPRRGLAAEQGVDPGAQVGIGGQGHVEPLAQAGRVEAEQAALLVDDRAAGGAPGQRGRVLEGAAHPPPAGAAEGAVDAAQHPDGEAGAAGGRAGHGVGERPDLGAAVGPGQRRGTGRVDGEQDEVAVHVGGHRGGLLGPAVRERDLRWCGRAGCAVGEHEPVGDDDAAPSAAAAPDADDRRAGVGEDGAGGLGEGAADRGGGGRGHGDSVPRMGAGHLCDAE